MKNKVTSYEISKRLHELGFECDNHCGWWINNLCDATGDPYWDDDEEGVINKIKLGEWGRPKDFLLIKAYDCWDLLMWLKEKGSVRLEANYTSNFYSLGSHYDWDVSEDGLDKEPQNALGKAVIEILQANLSEEAGDE